LESSSPNVDIVSWVHDAGDYFALAVIYSIFRAMVEVLGRGFMMPVIVAIWPLDTPYFGTGSRVLEACAS
jgi:hypothetical protein